MCNGVKKYGADPFTKDIYDYTPLEYALKNNNEKLFDDLCK
jgi:ankyrin repeat protein